MHGNNAVFHAETKMPFQRNCCKRISGRCRAVCRKAVRACNGYKHSRKLVHARHSRSFRLTRCCASACRTDHIPLIHNLYRQWCCRFEFKCGNAVFGIYNTSVSFCRLTARSLNPDCCIRSGNEGIADYPAVFKAG